MAKHLKTLLAAALLGALFTFAACDSSKKGTSGTGTQNDSTKLAYVCPMHPEVTSDKPANCSKCGMALVKKDR